MQDQPDLTSTVQELMAQLAQVKAELASLKKRTQALLQVEQSVSTSPTITTTRHKTLKRLGLALLSGAAAASAVSAPTAQAKIVANPTLTGSTSVVGALVLSPGTPNPTGTAPNGVHYGLIASSSFTALDLASLPITDSGVYGFGSTTGVYGLGNNYGVLGSSNFTGIYGSGNVNGVYSSGNTYGVASSGGRIGGLLSSAAGSAYSYMPETTSVGVLANAGVTIDLSTFGTNARTGIYATAGGAATNYAGWFSGDVIVTNNLGVNKNLTVTGVKAFKIDHPLDPANKFLYHSAIESPDMKNVYDGVTSLDEQGEATVTLPDWFEALNSDYRYQLTSIGIASPDLHIAEEINERKFKIAGGLPGQKVSWMVTGIRQDEWAKAHRMSVEEDKTDKEKGKYLHPEVFGRSEDLRISI